MFDYGFIDEHTDFSDNQTFGSAQISNTIIMTEKVFSTFLKRMQAMEDIIIEKVEQRVKLYLEAEARRTIEHDDVKKKSAESNTPIIYNVRESVDDFTGRDDVLQRINESFQRVVEWTVICVVVAGGGMGKTQVILRYVSQYKSQYAYFEGNERVFWMTAETKESISSAFRSLAEKMKLDIEKKSDTEILGIVQKKLPDFSKRSLYLTT
jgi:tetraacyldisaccharide-1-P 4'-kinase